MRGAYGNHRFLEVYGIGDYAVIESAWSWISALLASINWWTAVVSAATGMAILGLRLIMREPIKAATNNARVMRVIWFLSPQKPLGGKWEVSWRVSSTRYHPVNTDTVKVRRLFSNVTFTTRTTLLDGSTQKCTFLGKFKNLTITGLWYVPDSDDRGYDGVFQMRLHAGLGDGTGAWAGWTNDGRVETDEMSMRKVS
jgi:hypothetical protein